MNIFEALGNHPGVDVETRTTRSPDEQTLITTITAPALNTSVTILLDRNADTVDQAVLMACLFTERGIDLITETKADGVAVKSHLSPPED